MVDAIGSGNLVAVPMDRITKATLWVAFLILGSYFVWAFLNCAMDDTCHRSCPSAHGVMLPRGVNGCAYSKGPQNDQWWSPDARSFGLN
jgi:hypothetical protein